MKVFIDLKNFHVGINISCAEIQGWFYQFGACSNEQNSCGKDVELTSICNKASDGVIIASTLNLKYLVICTIICIVQHGSNWNGLSELCMQRMVDSKSRSFTCQAQAS